MLDIYEACKFQMRDGASEMALGPFLYSLVFITRAERAVDVGTGHGGSAVAMAIAMREMTENRFPTPAQHRDCRGGGHARFPSTRPRVTTIELPNVNHDEFTAAVDRFGLRPYIEIVKGDCIAYGRTLVDREWDLAFLDATKQTEEVATYVPLIRRDGFVVLHDCFEGGNSESGNGAICTRALDFYPALEGILCDTGFMSFRCYRVKQRVDGADLRAFMQSRLVG